MNIHRTPGVHSRFEKAIAMAIDGIHSIRIGHADVIRCNADNRTKLLVSLVDNGITLAPAASPQQPQIREGSNRRAWDASQGRIGGEVRQDKEIPDQRDQSCDGEPRRGEEVKESHCCNSTVVPRENFRPSSSIYARAYVSTCWFGR